jgi:copper transport protein
MKARRGAILRWLGCFVLLLALLTWPQAASAHATVVRAEPGFDEVVPQSPTEVRVQFSEPVKLGADALAVIAPSGRRVDRRDARVDERDPTLVRVSVQAGETGTYRVVWRVLSADAHVVAGSYTFSVGSPSEPPPETALASSTAWYWQAIARWVHLIALCLVGGPLVVSLLARYPSSTEANFFLWSLARRGALLGFVGTILFLLAQALGLGGSLGSAFDPTVLRSTLSGRVGLLSGIRLLLFWMLYLGFSYLHLRGARARFGLQLAALTLVVLIVITSLTGHPATTPPVPLSVAVDAIHLLATVIWLGGLLALVPLLARAQHEAASSEVSDLLRQVLPRYAITAMASFDVLLLTGAYQLWVNLERPAQLLDTGYGKALLVKGILIAGLVALGAASAWALRGVWRSPEPGRPGITRGRRFAALEAAVAILLLASVGILTALPPAKSTGPAAEPAAASPGVTLARNAGPFLATLTLAPAEPGTNQVTVVLQDPGGRPVEDAEVSLLVQPLGKAGPAPSRIRLERASDAFRGQVVVPSSGRWSLEVLVRHPTLAQEQRAAFEIAVPVPGAQLILERADAAMNRLRSLVEYNELTSGGPVVRTTAEYRARDRLRYVIETPGREPTTTIAVHDRRYDRVGDGPWTVNPWPGTEPFRWPNYRFAEGARDVLLLGTESIDGVDCYVVSFFDPRSGARYRMWIGTSDYLIRRYEMMAIGHYMVVSYHSFNDPSIQIDAPAAAGAP